MSKETSKRRWRGAVKLIGSLEMVHKGLAEIFDVSMSRISPVTVARTFGNQHYLSCTQLRQVVHSSPTLRLEQSKAPPLRLCLPPPPSCAPLPPCAPRR